MITEHEPMPCPKHGIEMTVIYEPDEYLGERPVDWFCVLCATQRDDVFEIIEITPEYILDLLPYTLSWMSLLSYYQRAVIIQLVDGTSICGILTGLGATENAQVCHVRPFFGFEEPLTIKLVNILNVSVLVV